MFACGRCDAQINDGALCCLCQRHFDFSCASITESGYRKLGKNKASWKCPQCKTRSHAGSGQESGNNTPGAITLEKLHEQMLSIITQLTPLRSLEEDIRTIKSDISELKESLLFAHDAIKAFSDRFAVIESELNQLHKQVEEVPKLKAEIVKLCSEKNERDQWLRMNNVEIKGVPVKNNENLFDLVGQVGSVLGYPIKKEDINLITRVPTYQKDSPKPIIVSFINRYVKEDFVSSMKKQKQLNANTLGFSGTAKIYVNDHLTPYYKQLLTKAKSAQKNTNFQFIWVKHSKIWARKTTNSKVFTINSELDLQKIC